MLNKCLMKKSLSASPLVVDMETIKNYKIVGRAGEGAHGLVLKAVDLKDNKLVAMKKIHINPDLPIPKNTMREILSLRALRSKYIVQLFEVTAFESSVVLVMEYLPCSLAEIIKNTDVSLNLAQIKRYAKMLFKGLDYIHERNVMHRDIKPANLLISPQRVLKIADFGLARIYEGQRQHRQYSHQVATRWYRAPELLYGSRSYNLSVDIWAAGCILAEMINRAPLFSGETDIEQLAIVLNTLGTPTDLTWPDMKSLPDYNKIGFRKSVGKSWRSIIPNANTTTLDLIKKMIMYNSNERISAAEALKHKFFTEDPKPAKLIELCDPEEVKTDADTHVNNFEDFDEIIEKINGI